MGYNTKYTLTTTPSIELKEADLETMSGGYSWEQFRNVWGIYDEAKWYDHDIHMIKFSKKKQNKNILFILKGEGEEAGDIWQAYYKNGKSLRHAATLSFPDFKEEDLE